MLGLFSVIILIKSRFFSFNISWLLRIDSANIGIVIRDFPIVGHWDPMPENTNHTGRFSLEKNWKWNEKALFFSKLLNACLVKKFPYVYVLFVLNRVMIMQNHETAIHMTDDIVLENLMHKSNIFNICGMFFQLEQGNITVIVYLSFSNSFFNLTSSAVHLHRS